MSGSRLAIVGHRLLQAVPSIIGIIVVTFLLTRALPGDPAAYFAGPAANEESIAQIRAQLGLDKSLPEQFWVYVVDLVDGDLGTSLTTGQEVTDDILRRLPASLELTLAALIFSIGVALPLGIMAALRENSWIDHLCRVVVTAGVSLPTFFTGLFLLYIFYYLLGLAPAPLGRLNILYMSPEPVTGLYTIDALIAGDFDTFWASFTQLILPSITLGLFSLAPIARMTRAAMLQVLGGEFVRTARAAGLSRRTVVITYALRNAILPVITTLGMVFSFMLGANVLVEKVFAWPGIGSYAIEALIASDYAAVQGFVLTMAILFVILNLFIDIIYTLVDPRVGIDS
jgi:peptide/nickel transport system permease protein